MFEKIDLGITTTLWCYNLMIYAQEMWKYDILCYFYRVSIAYFQLMQSIDVG